MTKQEEKEKILKDLEGFKSSFQLDQQRINPQRVIKVKKTTDEKHDDLTTPFQRNADKNLLTYLEYRTPDSENKSKAYTYNAEVRDSDPNNVIALANYARMLIDDDELRRADREVKKLKALKENGQLWAKAKAESLAELAYSHSKFGSHEHLCKAIVYFEEVLPLYPQRWDWRYRYGVVLQRCLNPEISIGVEDSNASDAFIKGLNALVEVIKCHDADATTRALAWTKVGSMLFNYNRVPKGYKKTEELAEKCLKDACETLGVTELSTSCCMQKALDFKGSNYEILQEYGRLCRRNKDFEPARKYLEKSYRIRKTTINSLHLGLLEVDEWNHKNVKQNQKQRVANNRKQFSYIESIFTGASRIMKTEDDPQNKKLNQALVYLDQASELCAHTSPTVPYHKGLVFRRLRRYEDAIQCFKQAMKTDGCNLVTKINAYEQQGYCYEGLAKDKFDTSPRQDAMNMFFFALENAVRLALPFQYHCQSSVTLRTLLKDELVQNPQSADNSKKFAYFHRLLRNYQQEMDYLNNVLELDPSDSEAYIAKANSFISNGKCEEAVNLLMMLLTTDHREHVLRNKDVLVKAATAAAEKNLRQGKWEIASEYFRRAYRAVFEMKDSEIDEKDCIFITGQESDNCFQYFSETIETYFGLSCVCSNDILPGQYENSSLSNALENSSNFLFVFPESGDELCGEPEFLRVVEPTLNCIQQKPSGSLYSVSVSRLGDLPQSLKFANFNDVPSYTSWRDVPEDSDEFVDLVMRLFGGITTLVCRS